MSISRQPYGIAPYLRCTSPIDVTQHLGVLQFEPLTDLVQSILVIGTQTGKKAIVSPSVPFSIARMSAVALNELVDHIELRIYALNQTVQSCIQLVLCVAGLNVHDLTMNNNPFALTMAFSI